MARETNQKRMTSAEIREQLSSSESFGRMVVYAAFQELLDASKDPPEERGERLSAIALALEELMLDKYGNRDQESLACYLMLANQLENRAKQVLDRQKYHSFCTSLNNRYKKAYQYILMIDCENGGVT